MASCHDFVHVTCATKLRWSTLIGFLDNAMVVIINCIIKSSVSTLVQMTP